MERFVAVITGAVAIAILLSAVGLLVTRRILPARLLENHNPVLGHAFSVLSVLSGIVLAFMVVAVWERHDEAREITDREANALTDLFRNAVAFGEPARTRLQDRIRGYTAAVVADEWTAMAQGRTSRDAAQAYQSVWREYLSLSPRTEREALWLDWSIEQLDELDNQRNLRLISSRMGLPRPMWITLYALSAMTLVFSYFFGIGTLRVHMIMSSAIAAALALVLALIWALQSPFGTVAPIPPTALHETIAGFEHWSQ